MWEPTVSDYTNDNLINVDRYLFIKIIFIIILNSVNFNNIHYKKNIFFKKIKRYTKLTAFIINSYENKVNNII